MTPIVLYYQGEQVPTSAVPDVVDVARLLRARTKVPGGAEAGTFNLRTRPTEAEVEGLIAHAVDEVLGKVGMPADDSDVAERVRRTVALYAAMLVELSYFPEQVRNDRSPFTAYERLYKSRVDALIVEMRTGEPGGDPTGVGTGATPADAAWYFPDDGGGLVGWGTRW